MRVTEPMTPVCISSNLLANAKWDVENAHFLEEFVDRYPLPHVALVTKGQYLDVGLPSVANPTLKPYLLAFAKQSCLKIIGHVVKMKDNKPAGLSPAKVAVSMDYRGFFEILSEDGRPTKSLESVAELSEKCVDLCLVRQRCKAYLPDADGELKNLHRSRSVQVGEILTVVGRFYLKGSQFLRCFDESGCSLFFKMRQKAKFSPIAKKNSISGVHTVANLSAKRLPLTVRLIHGQCPAEIIKLSGSAQPIFRLQSVVNQRFLFAYCLQKPAGQVVTIPLNAHIKLAPCINHTQVAVHPEFKELCNWCKKVEPSFLSRIALVNDEQLVQCLTKQPDGVNSSKSDFSSEPTDEEIDQLYDYIRGDYVRTYESRSRIQGRPRPPDSPSLERRLLQDIRLSSADRRTRRPVAAPVVHRRNPTDYQVEDRFFNFPPNAVPEIRIPRYGDVPPPPPVQPSSFDRQTTTNTKYRQYSAGAAGRARPKSLFIPETSPFFQCPPPMAPIYAGHTPAPPVYPAYAYDYRPSARYAENPIPFVEWAQPQPTVFLRQKFRYPGIYAYEV